MRCVKDLMIAGVDVNYKILVRPRAEIVLSASLWYWQRLRSVIRLGLRHAACYAYLDSKIS